MYEDVSTIFEGGGTRGEIVAVAVAVPVEVGNGVCVAESGVRVEVADGITEEVGDEDGVGLVAADAQALKDTASKATTSRGQPLALMFIGRRVLYGLPQPEVLGAHAGVELLGNFQ